MSRRARVGEGLDKLAAQVLAAAQDAMDEQVRLLRDDVAARAPKDTGALAESYEVEGPTPVGNGVTQWKVGSHLRYAAYREFGTRSHGHAQPHLRPAVHQAEPKIGPAIVAEVKRRVK